MHRRIDISHKTIFFIATFLLGLWALYQIIDVIVLLFIAIILMAGLSPLVKYLSTWKLPKTLSIGIAYLCIIAVIAGLISLIVTPLIDQTTKLIQTLPQTAQAILPPFLDPSIFQRELSNVASNALSFSLIIFNNFLAIISVLVLTFYLLLERDKLDGRIAQLFVGSEEQVKKTVRRIEEKLGAWLRGQLALSLIIGTLAYVLLLALQIPYALPLAILAGLFEIVPVIGPIISAIPAILVALTLSPLSAGFVALGYFVIQQLENSFIVPQVMKKAVGLNPLIVILAVSIGGKLLGISGALLAVPITVVIQILIEDLFNAKTLTELESEG
jgi:predicted PurR-regulated permease PerM